MDPKWTSVKGCYLLNGKCMARGSAPRARQGRAGGEVSAGPADRLGGGWGGRVPRESLDPLGSRDPLVTPQSLVTFPGVFSSLAD